MIFNIYWPFSVNIISICVKGARHFFRFSEQKHKEFCMKKLRFFGLLAATVLLAFALVVACSNGTTDPGPGPTEPGDGTPAYSIPPGGTGPSGTPINLPNATATGIKLDKTAVSIAKGSSVQVSATATPNGASVGRIVWNTTSGELALSTTGVAIANGYTGPTVTVQGTTFGDVTVHTVTAQAQNQASNGNWANINGAAFKAEFEVTLYDRDLVLKSTTPEDLKLLPWDVLKVYRDAAEGANGSDDMRGYVTSAAQLRIDS